MQVLTYFKKQSNERNKQTNNKQMNIWTITHTVPEPKSYIGGAAILQTAWKGYTKGNFNKVKNAQKPF